MTVAPSSSWVRLTYSVSKRILEPRSAAWPIRIGSKSVCGRSQGSVGLACV